MQPLRSALRSHTNPCSKQKLHCFYNKQTRELNDGIITEVGSLAIKTTRVISVLANCLLTTSFLALRLCMVHDLMSIIPWLHIQTFVIFHY